MGSALSGIALLVFCTMCFLALFKRHWAIVLIFSFFGYEQLLSAYIGVLGRKTWIINVVVGLVAMSCLVISMVLGKRPFRGAINVTSVLVLMLIVFSYFGATYSPMRPAGIYFVKTGFPYMILLLVILPGLVCGTEQINKMCLPLLVMGCALVVLILVSPRTVFYGLRMFIDLSYTKGTNARGNPLAIAELGGVMVIIASLMKQNIKNPVVTIIRIGSIVLGISIAFLAASRGQLLFSIFVSILFFPVAYRIKSLGQFFIRAGSVGVTALIIGVVAKLFLFNTESAGRFSTEDIAAGLASRSYYITTMLSEYAARPMNYLQGLGTGSFNAYVKTKSESEFVYPHNLFVEILTDHGLIGFSMLIGIIVFTGLHTIRLLKLIPSGAIDRHAVAIVLALAGYTTLISMKQGSYLLIPIPFYMYLIISKLYCRHMADSWGGHDESYADDSLYSDCDDDGYEVAESY